MEVKGHDNQNQPKQRQDAGHRATQGSYENDRHQNRRRIETVPLSPQVLPRGLVKLITTERQLRRRAWQLQPFLLFRDVGSIHHL